MVFFNTKEEVLDIELTPYGKYLLSKGKWKPAYYEFYDDDVVYDSEYFGYQESQSEIVDRITETKRPKVQYTFDGAETRLKEYKKQLSTNPAISQDSFLEKRKSLYTNFLALGNSSADKNYYPAFRAKFLAGKVQNVSGSVSLVGVPNNINTIVLEDLFYTKFVNYTDNLGRPFRTSGESSLDVELNNETRTQTAVIFNDGAYIDIIEEEIFIDVGELFTDDKIDNFDISIFEITDTGELPLSFVDVQKETKTVNNLLVDNPDYNLFLEKKARDEFLRKDFVNYYFDIRLDKEISERVLCKYLSKEEISRLKIVEGYDISCEDVQQVSDRFEYESLEIPEET